MYVCSLAKFHRLVFRLFYIPVSLSKKQNQKYIVTLKSIWCMQTCSPCFLLLLHIAIVTTVKLCVHQLHSDTSIHCIFSCNFILYHWMSVLYNDCFMSPITLLYNLVLCVSIIQTPCNRLYNARFLNTFIIKNIQDSFVKNPE